MDIPSSTKGQELSTHTDSVIRQGREPPGCIFISKSRSFTILLQALSLEVLHLSSLETKLTRQSYTYQLQSNAMVNIVYLAAIGQIWFALAVGAIS